MTLLDSDATSYDKINYFGSKEITQDTNIP